MSNLSKTFLLGLALALGPATSAFSQMQPEVAAAAEAYEAAWSAAPLHLSVVTLATEAGGYGSYVARENNIFAPGEPILIHAEPVGYGWAENATGGYDFGFDIDLVVYDGTGEAVLEKADFMKLGKSSFARMKEFSLDLTLNLDGAPAGDYVVEYTLRDIASDKTTAITMPIVIK